MNSLTILRRATGVFNTTLLRPAAYFGSVAQEAVKADPNSSTISNFSVLFKVITLAIG